MATDPYGYADSTDSSVPVTTALWYSVGACMCAALGMCACYIPFFIGSPLGLYGAWQANKALATAKGDQERAVATAALAAGVVGGLVSTMFALFIMLYLLFFVLYFVVIMLAVAGGSM